MPGKHQRRNKNNDNYLLLLLEITFNTVGNVKNEHERQM